MVLVACKEFQGLEEDGNRKEKDRNERRGREKENESTMKEKVDIRGWLGEDG